MLKLSINFRRPLVTATPLLIISYFLYKGYQAAIDYNPYAYDRDKFWLLLAVVIILVW